MYDTLIIGNDLSSLVAAFHLNQSGLKTVLLTNRDSWTNFVGKGYVFPSGPLPFVGALSEFTLSKLSEYSFAPFSPFPSSSFQVFSPNHRFDLFQNKETTMSELYQECHASQDKLNDVQRTLDAAASSFLEYLVQGIHSKEKCRLERILYHLRYLPSLFIQFIHLNSPKLLRDKRFRWIFDAGLSALSSIRCQKSNGLSLSDAYALSTFRRSFFYPTGIWNDWMNDLYQRFQNDGGVLITNYEAVGLEASSEIIIDLNVVGTPMNLRSRCLILSAQSEKIFPLILEQKGFRKLRSKIRTMRCTGYPLSLHMGVREEGIPEQLAPSAVFVKEPPHPRWGLNCLLFEMSLPGQTEKAPLGRRAIKATIYLQDSPLGMDDNELQDVIRDMFSSLEMVIPFLRESLDFLDIQGSIDVSRKIQEVVYKRYVIDKKCLLGMHSLSPLIGSKNVFLTGGALKPGLGFEGEILAGLETAYLAKKSLKIILPRTGENTTP